MSGHLQKLIHPETIYLPGKEAKAPAATEAKTMKALRVVMDEKAPRYRRLNAYNRVLIAMQRALRQKRTPRAMRNTPWDTWTGGTQ